ncbi:hypothetical protein ACKKBG_A14340 [Auxenochlorella protothecoides x Auxenochlorella symbiontica]
MAQQPLAISDTAHGAEIGWRRGQDLITALPYVDALTAESRAAVERLVQEELARSDKTPADYLAELPRLLASRLDEGSLVAQELERVARGEQMAEMDTVRYNLDPPSPSSRESVDAWQQALDNSHSQLEHQYTRLINLELLLKFGPDAWRVRNETLTVQCEALKRRLAAVKKETEDLNRSRKLSQLEAGRQLSSLQAEYTQLVAKNAEIEAACLTLESQAAALGDQGGGDSDASMVEATA